MKKFLFLVLFATLPNFAHAGDDALSCGKKHDGSIHCDVKKDSVVVDAISINGGACEVPPADSVLHHAYNSGEQFLLPLKSGGIPSFSGCSYIRSVTIKTHDGKSLTFAPL